MKKFITTPIYYVNDVPHIGHTYTTVAADVITRYFAQNGNEAYLLTGTDEHGAKIEEAAKKHDKSPKEYADEISGKFKSEWKKLNINFARFIRTTDEDHINTARDFLQRLYDVEAIEHKPRLYTGLYCVGHEKFMSPEELIDGLCPDHKTKPIEHSEENYYFKLSSYQNELIELISSEKIKIGPESRKNEILGKLNQGLDDISISRANLKWGVPLPFDESHTTYVWVEALINYYTFGKPNDLWPATLHLVGKDILWFHAIIWPAMLLAIGEQLPEEIFAHGFFTINGEKMSKTIGNVISPQQLIGKYGVDGTRYVLLTSFPFGEDGDFSWEYFDRIYNADLANGIGNLVARVAKLCEKNNISGSGLPTEFDPKIIPLYESLKFNEAIDHLKSEITNADKEINAERPWELEGEKAEEVLEDLVKRIQHIAFNLQPFLPETAEKILAQFSGEIKYSAPLFPRI
jgi:methionyl-tRNA synthetase